MNDDDQWTCYLVRGDERRTCSWFLLGVLLGEGWTAVSREAWAR